MVRSQDVQQSLMSLTTKTTGAILTTYRMPDLTDKKVGLLVCACGGNEARMRTIAEKMHGEVVSVCRCKQAIENKPGAPLKCLRPGNCPVRLRTTCSSRKMDVNTSSLVTVQTVLTQVMASAPQMGLKVFHQTDHVMRALVMHSIVSLQYLSRLTRIST